MDCIDWRRCFDEAMSAAFAAGSPRTRSAYLDLAQFYCDQAQRHSQHDSRSLPNTNEFGAWLRNSEAVFRSGLAPQALQLTAVGVQMQAARGIPSL